MPQSYASLFIHTVFSTKIRKPWLEPDFTARLFEYMGGTCRGNGSVLRAAGGMPDHVHLLVSISREIAVADFVRDVKASSSRWIHDTFPDRAEFAWQSGYGVFSVSQSKGPVVQRYIDNQAKHHRRLSFQEEFVALLKRHEIPYDERYLWD